MVARSFTAYDNENLVVTSSSSGSIVGNPIINNSNTPNGTVFSFSSGSAQQITLDDTGGNADRFEDGDHTNHIITDGGGLVANGTGVEAESLIYLRQLDDNGNPTGPTITVTVFSKGGNYSDIWGYATDTPLVDGASYTKTGGSNAGTAQYETFVACFGPDTVIDAEGGGRPIHLLEPGDRVWTLEAGLQPVRWVGRHTVKGTGRFAPVVIAAGVFGNDAPLTVSPEHRIYLEDPATSLLFGEGGVLVAAKHLTHLPGVAVVPHEIITYTHFMCDTHHVVRSNGMLSESFLLAEHSVLGLPDPQRRELLALFPALADSITAFGPAAAPCLKAHEARLWQHHRAA